MTVAQSARRGSKGRGLWVGCHKKQHYGQHIAIWTAGRGRFKFMRLFVQSSARLFQWGAARAKDWGMRRTTIHLSSYLWAHLRADKAANGQPPVMERQRSGRYVQPWQAYIVHGNRLTGILYGMDSLMDCGTQIFKIAR